MQLHIRIPAVSMIFICCSKDCNCFLIIQDAENALSSEPSQARIQHLQAVLSSKTDGQHKQLLVLFEDLSPTDVIVGFFLFDCNAR